MCSFNKLKVKWTKTCFWPVYRRSAPDPARPRGGSLRCSPRGCR